MPIAKYTQEMMNDLQEYGEARICATHIGDDVARSRLHNAARHLRVQITTEKHRTQMWAKVVICPRFDRFDICEAYRMYAILWHTGQTSKNYKILGRLEDMGFKPSPMRSRPADLPTQNAREIYYALMRKDPSYVQHPLIRQQY